MQHRKQGNLTIIEAEDLHDIESFMSQHAKGHRFIYEDCRDMLNYEWFTEHRYTRGYKPVAHLTKRYKSWKKRQEEKKKHHIDNTGFLIDHHEEDDRDL